MRRIAGALHHGNGDCAVHDDVGHRAARDHAVEAGRHHRHLGRPAAIAAHGHQRHVGQELVAADGVERLAEEDVGDDDGRGDGQRQPENAVGVEVEIDDDAAPARALGVEHAGQQPGEVRVEQARQADPHQRPAGQAAHALQHEQDDGAAEQDLVPGEQAELVGDRRIEDGDVAADHEAGHDQDPVVPRHHVGRRLRARLDGEEHRRQAETEEQAEVLLVEDRPGQVVVDLRRPRAHRRGPAR